MLRVKFGFTFQSSWMKADSEPVLIRLNSGFPTAPDTGLKPIPVSEVAMSVAKSKMLLKLKSGRSNTREDS